MTNFSLSVFVNYAAQDCRSYLLSMGKLKSFKFSLQWDQEQISDLMYLIFSRVHATLQPPLSVGRSVCLSTPLQLTEGHDVSH